MSFSVGILTFLFG